MEIADIKGLPFPTGELYSSAPPPLSLYTQFRRPRHGISFTQLLKHKNNPGVFSYLIIPDVWYHASVVVSSWSCYLVTEYSQAWDNKYIGTIISASDRLSVQALPVYTHSNKFLASYKILVDWLSWQLVL